VGGGFHIEWDEEEERGLLLIGGSGGACSYRITLFEANVYLFILGL